MNDWFYKLHFKVRTGIAHIPDFYRRVDTPAVRIVTGQCLSARNYPKAKT